MLHIANHSLFAILPSPSNLASPFQRGRYSQIRRSIVGANELEVRNKLALLAGRQGIVDTAFLPRHKTMARGKRGPHQMLITEGYVENCTSSRRVEPLVAIAHEEVWIQLREVERDMADSMGSVYTRQDIVLLAEFREPLKWHPHAR